MPLQTGDASYWKIHYWMPLTACQQQPCQPDQRGIVPHKHQRLCLLVQDLGHGSDIILGPEARYGCYAAGWLQMLGQIAAVSSARRLPL